MVIIACSVLLLWNTYRSTYNHKRTNLAYSELTKYLQLSGEVFRTFKQIRRDVLNEGGKLNFDLDQAQGSISEIISEISDLAAEESAIGLRTGEALEDVARAHALSEELVEAFADVRRSIVLLKNGTIVEAKALLGNSLETRIDGKVAQVIEAAVNDERVEVAEALEEIEQTNLIASWAAIGATLSGLLLTGWVIYILALRLRISLRNLESGAELFAAGQLDHRIPVSGSDEFAKLSHRFNSMAGQLRNQHQALEDARASLENRVMERTEELRTVNVELQRRDEMRRQFFADIGHELRTPITAVRGEAEVALRSRVDHRETYRSALERIVDITGQLTRFVNDIFLIAREQAGVSDMRRDEVDLREAITAATEQLRSMIEEHQCKLSLDIGEVPAMIEGDSQRLCQLIQILISNAIQHSPAGVNVRASLVCHDAEWQLSIEDDGQGISKEEATRVFERFYRGGGTFDHDQARNTGLGLPIARSIANSHGGRIWIDTSYSGGTAVRISLPLIDCGSDDSNALPDNEMEAYS